MFSIDKVGDAVKEFNLRAKDGSNTTIEAFQALGMNADEMTKRFAAGGESAEEAFFEVVNALNNMDDPIAKTRLRLICSAHSLKIYRQMYFPCLPG